MSFCHVIHPPERPRKYTRRFRKCIIHLAKLYSRLPDFVANSNGDLLQYPNFRTQTLNCLVILALEVVCETMAVVVVKWG